MKAPSRQRELDELRGELQEAREEIARLKADRDKDRRRRPGPVMTIVLAGFIVAGGVIILGTATHGRMPDTPVLTWVAVSGAAGLAATLIFDHAKRLPLERLEWLPAIVRTGLSIGGVFLAGFIADQILRAALGPARYATGHWIDLLIVSFTVGAVVALSLRAMEAGGPLRRIRRL